MLSPTAGFDTYSWSPATGLSCTNCQNPTATPATTTTYTLTATGINGCPMTDQITVTVKSAPVVNSVSSASPTSCVSNNGTITVFATGLNLQYSINNGSTFQNSNVFSGLGSGTYEVVVKNSASGCTAVYPNNPIVLAAPNSPQIASVTPANPTDCGVNNGSITIQASGSNLEYSINGGTTYFANNTFLNLAAGTYNIRVRNSVSLCTTIGTTEVLTAPVAPSNLSATATPTTDCAISDGTISVSASGGVAPLQYSLGGAVWQNSSAFTGLPAGSYTVFVRNANATCSTQIALPVSVGTPAQPSITNVVASQPTNCGSTNGSLTVTATGGVGQLEFSIDGTNWQTSNVFSGLASGSYSVFVRNQDNSCPNPYPANPVIVAPANAPTIGSFDPAKRQFLHGQ